MEAHLRNRFLYAVSTTRSESQSTGGASTLGDFLECGIEFVLNFMTIKGRNTSLVVLVEQRPCLFVGQCEIINQPTSCIEKLITAMLLLNGRRHLF